MYKLHEIIHKTKNTQGLYHCYWVCLHCIEYLFILIWWGRVFFFCCFFVLFCFLFCFCFFFEWAILSFIDVDWAWGWRTQFLAPFYPGILFGLISNLLEMTTNLFVLIFISTFRCWCCRIEAYQEQTLIWLFPGFRNFRTSLKYYSNSVKGKIMKWES